jgi:hypothetical protein
MRENIQKAHEIRNGVTGQYRSIMMKLQEKEAKIKQDVNLSTVGQQEQIAKLKKEHSRELMQFAKQVKDEYQMEVIRAKGKAERFLENPNKKPDDSTLKKYEHSLNDLKTRVLLSIRPDRAAEMVAEYAKGIEDPYIASQLREQFAEVITPIISQANGADGAKLKASLTDVYSKLESNFITDEQSEAKQVIEQADAMFSAKLFNPLVIDNIKDSYDRRTADYINTPDTYFHLEKAEGEKEQE